MGRAMKRPLMKQTDPRSEAASIGNTLVIGNVPSRNKIYKKLRRLSDRRTCDFRDGVVALGRFDKGR
jgi:hypothetical protein